MTGQIKRRADSSPPRRMLEWLNRATLDFAAGMRTSAGYVLLSIVVASYVLFIFNGHNTLSFDKLPGPDSWTRAVLLRDALETGSWQQILGRDSSGYGTSLHWTRLVELLALPFVLLLEPLLGRDGAILAVATLFGPVMLGSLTAALWWAARPFVAWKPAMLFVPAAAVLAPALLAYGGAGRFGHHLIIPLCVTLAFAHAVRAASGRGGCANSAVYAGVWCGIGTAFSVEMMPFALLAFAGLAFAWVLDGDEAAVRRVEGCALGFTVIVAAAWLLDPPNGGLLSIEADRLSLPYVLLGPLLLAAAKVLRCISLPGAGRRLAALLAAGLLTGMLWLAAFPEIAQGIAPGTPAEVQRLIWDNNPELQPIRQARRLIGWGAGGILCLLVFLLEFSKVRRDWRSFWLLSYATFCAATLLAISVIHIRFTPYASAAGAVALAILASHLRNRAGLLPAMIFATILAVAPFYAAATETVGAQIFSCHVAEAAKWLKNEREVVYVDIDVAPELLWRTRAMTVGTLYHRGYKGIARYLRASRALTDDDARAALEAARVKRVLLCLPPPNTRAPYIADLPETAMERWQRGQLPGWLHKDYEDDAAGLVLLSLSPE
ncbi:MAG: hypothetical protein ACREDD_08565 [Methylocella sp.]